MSGYTSPHISGTDYCKFISNPAQDMYFTLEQSFWYDIAKQLDKKILILCDRTMYSIPATLSFYKALTQSGFKPDLVIILFACELNLMNVDSDTQTGGHRNLEQGKRLMLKQNADIRTLYDSIQEPKVILSSDPNQTDPYYNIIHFNLFYFLTYNHVTKITPPQHKQHKLSCLNRVARPSRIHMFTNLVNEDFFKDVYFSFHGLGLTKTKSGNILRDTNIVPKTLYEYMGPSRVAISDTELQYIDDTLKQHWHLLPIRAQDKSEYSPKDKEQHPGLDVNDAYSNSVCNIATETTTWWADSNVFLTEKTFKPIAIGMPFFVQASCGSISYLRQQGFDVYDDVLDHSYDTEVDYAKRQTMLVNSIRTFMQTDYVRDIDREKRNIENFYSDETYNSFFDPFIKQLKKIK